jgi:hypothetical protein
MSNTLACGFTPKQMAFAAVLYFLAIKIFMKGVRYTFNDVSTIYEGLISAIIIYVYTDVMNWVMAFMTPKEEATPRPTVEVEEEEEESPLSPIDEESEDSESVDSSDSEWLPYSYRPPAPPNSRDHPEMFLRKRASAVDNDSPVYVPSFQPTNDFYISDADQEEDQDEEYNEEAEEKQEETNEEQPEDCPIVENDDDVLFKIMFRSSDGSLMHTPHILTKTAAIQKLRELSILADVEFSLTAVQ